MAFRLGQIRIRITPGGQLVTEAAHLHTAFDSFLQKMDPGYKKPKRPLPDDMNDHYGRPRNKVMDIANDAHFTLNQRKGKHTFGFGFARNEMIGLEWMLKNWYPSTEDQSRTEQEKIDWILKKRPSVYETDACESTGERLFCRPIGNFSKGGWGWEIGCTDIIAHHDPKEKAV